MNLFHYAFDKLYPVIRFTYEKVQGNDWYTEILPDELWLGGAPTYKRDYDFLLANGITAVIDIREERLDDVELYKKHNIDFLKLRVLDILVPNNEQFDQADEFMRRNIENGGIVYVHCAKGRGRSGVLVMAYLMRYHGMTFEEAVEFTIAKRPLLKQRARHKKASEAWLATQSPLGESAS